MCIRDRSETSAAEGCGTTVTRTWTATDICGNTTSATQQITVIEGFEPALTIPNSACVNESVTLSVAPAGANYTYNWTVDQGVLSTANAASSTFVSSETGTVTITVEVQDITNGCTGTITRQLTIEALPTVTASSNSPVCFDEELLLTASGGADSYLWTGPNGFTSTLQNPSHTSLNEASAGEYIVQATYGSCVVETSTMVEIGSALNTTILGESVVCMNSSLVLSVQDGEVFRWTGPNGFTAATQEINLSLIHISEPRDRTRSRMPSSA